jgi:hypothetical protein
MVQLNNLPMINSFCSVLFKLDCVFILIHLDSIHFASLVHLTILDIAHGLIIVQSGKCVHEYPTMVHVVCFCVPYPTVVWLFEHPGELTEDSSFMGKKCPQMIRGFLWRSMESFIVLIMGVWNSIQSGLF